MSRAKDRLQAKITKLYMDMRLKRISKVNWMIETEQTLEQLREIEQTDISAELFFAQFLITKGALQQAEEVLEECAKWLRMYTLQAPAYHAYYLYLTTLTKEDPVYEQKVLKKMLELSKKYPDIWQISWLLYYVDTELEKDPLEQYHFLKRMFLRGCRSPLMYLEARILLERNPTFLYEFSEFEVQLIVFMLRHAGISERVGSILGEYMLLRTEYRYIYLIILCGCYEVMPSRRLLEGICNMLVLGGCVGEQAAGWYRTGIAEHIPAEGMYEAFLRSLPIEDWRLDGQEFSNGRGIPYEVLTYFAHAVCPDTVRTAYLYAFVHKYREKWQSLYLEYEPLIQSFVSDQLYHGNVNAGLAYLYENCLQQRDITKDCLEDFTDICYSCQIRELPIQEGTLCIRYAHMNQEIRVPITGRSLIVPLFGHHYTLSVEQYNGAERLLEQAEIYPLMQEQQWCAFLKQQQPQNLLFHMVNIEDALDKNRMPAEEESSVKKVLNAKEISMNLKEEIAKQLFPYWDMNGAYEKILEAVPNVFVEFGIYSKAKELEFWKAQHQNDRIGIYGIQFLMDHYEGSLLEYGSIFVKAKSLGMELGDYAKNLLEAMIQDQYLLPQHIEILEVYCESQPSEELAGAFLELEAQQAYWQEKPLETWLLQKQAQYALQGYPFSVLAQLSFLQQIVQNGVGNIGTQAAKTAKKYIQEFLKAHIYFSWMQPLKSICPELESQEAFEVLEYRGEEKAAVWVRYELFTDGMEEADLIQTEEMQQICEGVYAKRFILFFTQRVRYEIFVMEGEEKCLKKRGILQRGQSISKTRESRFAKLNHMLALREEQDKEALYQELERYYGQNAIVDEIFSIK